MSPSDVHIRGKKKSSEQIIWQRSSHPVDIEILLAGQTPGLRLVDTDFDVLDFCLRCNYVTPTQACELGLSRSRAHARLGKLHQIGLLDRAWRVYERYIDMSGFRERRIGGWVYALSVDGFKFLSRSGNRFAKQWDGDWTARSSGEGTRKLSVSHELKRNAVLFGLLSASKQLGDLVVSWEGPRESEQYVAPRSPGAKSIILEPDGLLILNTGRPLFLEYEQSGRIDRFTNKMLSFNRYVAASGWKDRGFNLRPWVVYAVGSGEGTQERASGSFGGLVKLAHQILAAERHYLFLDETAWVQGDWQATTGEGKQVPFWETVLGW